MWNRVHRNSQDIFETPKQEFNDSEDHRHENYSFSPQNPAYLDKVKMQHISPERRINSDFHEKTTPYTNNSTPDDALNKRLNT